MSTIKKAIKYIKYRLSLFADNLKFKKRGKNSKIIRPLHISGKSRISIGDNVYIFKGARIQTISKWGNTNCNGCLTIGSGTSIEQYCHIIAADNITIGVDCVFSAFVYISDCSHQFIPGLKIMDADLVCKPVYIGNHCFIGIGSCIMPGVTLGDNVVIGANSVVTSSIPSNSMAVGSPAKVIKKWNCDSQRFENV